MVEVILTNLQRINQLWPIFLSHVMELLSHPKGSIRNAAIEALAKAVVGALSHIKSAVAADHSQVGLASQHLCNTFLIICCEKCKCYCRAACAMQQLMLWPKKVDVGALSRSKSADDALKAR